MIKSLRVLREKAENGDLEAQCRLADLYLCRETDEGNRAAIPWLRKAARAGDVYAQYNLGLCYRDGDGVPRNRRISVNWLKKAAKQGYEKAAQRLSEMDI